MTHQDPQTADVATPASHLDPEERERLAYTLTTRFAPHLQAAVAEVREAERALAEAREALSTAQQEAASQRYQSDRLVFMRASLADELEALARKTTEKKVRTGYRYLLTRAVELAEGEVQGYRSDQQELQRNREHSVEACLQAERQAAERLEAARRMQSRVQEAEQAAVQGLAVLVDKLTAPQPEATG